MFPDQWEKLAFELTDLVRYDSGALLQVYRSGAPRYALRNRC